MISRSRKMAPLKTGCRYRQQGHGHYGHGSERVGGNHQSSSGGSSDLCMGSSEGLRGLFIRAPYAGKDAPTCLMTSKLGSASATPFKSTVRLDLWHPTTAWSRGREEARNHQWKI